MKKITFCLMMIMLSLNAFPNPLNTEGNLVLASKNASEMPVEIKVLINRLEEINEMDKTALSYSEKKSLRKEVKTINTTLRSSGHGVYLSVGAIIIIILLLILLL
jgi:hypothetical protein